MSGYFLTKLRIGDTKSDSEFSQEVPLPATATRTHLWFLNTLLTPRVSSEEGSDGFSMLEHLAPRGDSPPLHLHHNEDEIFHILDGELRFRVADEELRLGADETLLAPKGTPHTYVVESERARWLVATTNGDFERFARSFSRPAERAELPEPAPPPTPEQAEALAAACRENGIELVGPPLH
jgi:mannose-6-phosphate isomerase-like protein (cupin superfamily)